MTSISEITCYINCPRQYFYKYKKNLPYQLPSSLEDIARAKENLLNNAVLTPPWDTPNARQLLEKIRLEEKKVKIEISKYKTKVQGTIDARDGKTGYYLKINKKRTQIFPQSAQVLFFAAACEKLQLQPQIVVITPTTAELITIEISRPIEKLIQLSKQVETSIKQEAFFPRPDWQCSSCCYEEHCKND